MLFCVQEEVTKLEQEVASIEQKKIQLASKIHRVKSQLSLLQKYSDNLTSSCRTTKRSSLAEQDSYGTQYKIIVVIHDYYVLIL